MKTYELDEHTRLARKISNGDGPATCYKSRTADTAIYQTCIIMLSLCLRSREAKVLISLRRMLTRMRGTYDNLYRLHERTSTVFSFHSFIHSGSNDMSTHKHNNTERQTEVKLYKK